MSYFFLDSSAIVKRYVPESGTIWLVNLTQASRGHTIIISEITQTEVAAAIAAKHRARHGITLQERDNALNIFLQHCNTEYQMVPVNRIIFAYSIQLTQNHRLRGYDAIQLATALVTNKILTANGFLDLTFISADTDLILATQAEGLPTDNPNLYT